MNIGKLKKRIRILKLEEGGVDEEGFDLGETWREVWSCWAQVSETSGTELIKSGAEFSKTKKRFLIRHTNVSIDTDMVVEYAGETYPIVLVNTYGDNHKFTEIWTERSELV